MIHAAIWNMICRHRKTCQKHWSILHTLEYTDWNVIHKTLCNMTCRHSETWRTGVYHTDTRVWHTPDNLEYDAQGTGTQRYAHGILAHVVETQVSMRLRAFYDDACFTVDAQDAFLSGFAAEVAHALNIDVGLVLDLNAFRTEKHNEMEVLCAVLYCVVLVVVFIVLVPHTSSYPEIQRPWWQSHGVRRHDACRKGWWYAHEHDNTAPRRMDFYTHTRQQKYKHMWRKKKCGSSEQN